MLIQGLQHLFLKERAGALRRDGAELIIHLYADTQLALAHAKGPAQLHLIAEVMIPDEILLTSMDRDGTKIGFNLPLTRAVSDAVSIPVIASGGVGNLQHLADGVLQGHADAVLAASIFHFGEYTVAQAKQLMQQHGIEVRL